MPFLAQIRVRPFFWPSLASSWNQISIRLVLGRAAIWAASVSLIPKIARADAESHLDFAQDRMKKKVLGAIEALRGGVGKVIFADGRGKEPILKALAGGGTHIG